MKIQSAVINGVNEDFKLTDMILDDPQAGEVLVKMVASGICHTDATVKDGTMPPQANDLRGFYVCP